MTWRELQLDFLALAVKLSLDHFAVIYQGASVAADLQEAGEELIQATYFAAEKRLQIVTRLPEVD